MNCLDSMIFEVFSDLNDSMNFFLPSHAMSSKYLIMQSKTVYLAQINSRLETKVYVSHVRAYFTSMYKCVYENLPTLRNSEVAVE